MTAEVEKPAVKDNHGEEPGVEEKRAGKKARKRKKGAYRRLVSQLEFYLSDANLRNSKHLLPIYQECPWIALTTFLNFNRVSELLTELECPKEEGARLEQLVKALTVIPSSSLSLSEDNTKVTRKEPFVSKDNREEVDGCTVYVEDLPEGADHDAIMKIFSVYGEVVYVSLPRFRSGRLKGFAFIEFSSSEGVTKVLNAFKHVTGDKGEELASVKTFQQEQAGGTAKRKSDVDLGSKGPPAKKAKLEASPIIPDDITSSKYDQDTLGDRLNSDLRVLSKAQWKKLRNKYLNDQRANFVAVKNSLKKHKVKKDAGEKTKTEVKSCELKESQTSEKKTDVIEQVTGIIVKVKVEGGVDNIQHFKRKVRDSLNGEQVAYVDGKVGVEEVFIRCVDSGQADRLVREMGEVSEVVMGDEELKYWDRIRLDREDKRSGKVTVKKPNKKAKLLKKVELAKSSHIYFD